MAGNLYEQGYYETGTASITQGQTVVTGQGTAWLQIVRPADDFGKHVGMAVPIASVDSDTQITLAYPWPGPTQAAAPYRISFTPYYVNYRQALLEIGRLLVSGNVSALAELVGAANKLPMFTGSGAMGLIAKEDLINGVRFDVQVDDLAGRAAHDGEASGFTVLVADVGDGRSAVYTKNSLTSADWSDPAYVTGPTGATGHEAYVYIGYASNAAGADFTTTFDPALEFIAILTSETEIPAPSAGDFAGLWFNYKGATGSPWDDWRGPWQTGTAYSELAGVEHGGSSYICTVAHNSGAATEPGAGASWQTYWDLVAAKGQDGTGTGDVVGPAAATDGNVAVFDGATGKLIEDSGNSLSDFLKLSGGTLTGILAFNRTLGPSNQLLDLQQGYSVWSDNVGSVGDSRLWFNSPNNGEMYFGPRFSNQGLAFLRAYTDRLQVRHRDGSILFDVVENNLYHRGNDLFHQGNILGTVSQSVGVPTGAVIEYGSNANGEYIRYADGTQICWLKKVGADGINQAYSSLFLGTYSWSFPAAFASPPAVDCSNYRWGTSASWGTVGAITASSVQLRGLDVLSRPAGTGIDISAIAIGRWY